MDQVNLVQAAISVASGGVGGAAVNAYFNWRRQKLDVAIIVIKDFFALYEDLGKVKGIFIASDTKMEETLENEAYMNLLRRVGDWFHFVVSLQGVADISLLKKAGITEEIEKFRETVSAAQGRHPKLGDVWRWWPRLQYYKST